MDLSKKLNINQLKRDGPGIIVAGNDKFKRTENARIFCRVDYNVPLNKQTQEVTDTLRIDSTIPTIEKMLSLDPDYIVLCSHLGRPEGNKKPKMSLAPVAKVLSSKLNKEVIFVEDWFKGATDLPAKLKSVPKNAIVLLENVRFYIEEEGKGVIEGKKEKAKPESVKELRALLTSIADVFVCDAFGTAHRGHSSMVGCDVPIKVAGLLVQKELEYFDKALSNPQRPYLAILGGAKVTDKIQVINSLLDRVNEMIIGGGMCFTFRKVADNMSIGKSLFDEEGAKTVQQLLDKAKEKNVKIILPTDFVCGDDFKADAKVTNATVEGGIPEGAMGLDIGPKSIQAFQEAIGNAKTIIWNGPPGVFEFEAFSQGTKAVLEACAKATAGGATTIVGGGDSAAACDKFGYSDKVSHVSTGGGASLELLEGKQLPGIVYLSDA